MSSATAGVADTAPLLVLDGIGKSYPTYRSLAHRVARWFGLGWARPQEHWVLRDISFAVRPGEAVALMGLNGAGKSTVLKIVTGTVRASAGRHHVRGRVSALLELGLGFNPEFTGRQNVHMAGGLMGLSTAELDALMPAIEDFAELGEYFAQPLRTYSSGMQMRLAFAVATCRQPELLIVDEALAVGDAYFQHKSFARIRQFAAAGTTILLVSHDTGAIRALCHRAILLDAGRLVLDGAPDLVTDRYNALLARREEARRAIESERRPDGWLQTRSGSGEARIAALTLVDAASGAPTPVARTGQRVRLQLDIEVVRDIPRLVAGVMLRDRTGHVVWGTNTFHTGQVVQAPRAGERIAIGIEFPLMLGPGSYSVSPALVSESTHVADNFEWIDNLLVFEVVNADRTFFIGSTSLDSQWTVERRTP